MYFFWLAGSYAFYLIIRSSCWLYTYIFEPWVFVCIRCTCSPPIPKFSGPTWPTACWSEAPRQPKLTEHPKNCLEVEFHLFSFPFWITSWQVRACSFGKCINKESVQDILREQVLRGEPCFGPIQDTLQKLVVQKVMLFGLLQETEILLLVACWVSFWKTSELHVEAFPLKAVHWID